MVLVWLVKLGLGAGCVTPAILGIEEVAWREGSGGFTRLGPGAKCVDLDCDGGASWGGWRGV